MKKLIPNTMNFIGSIILLVFLFIQFSFIDNKKNEPLSHELKLPELPSKINFAGEETPLARWDVKERLDREMLINFYGQENILFLLKMSIAISLLYLSA